MMASGDSFRQYLDVQGRFDRYSVANAILVSAQMPEATQLKEYSKWKANRVYVNKDAQKIIILGLCCVSYAALHITFPYKIMEVVR